jgi:hypothetical protein
MNQASPGENQKWRIIPFINMLTDYHHGTNAMNAPGYSSERIPSIPTIFSEHFTLQWKYRG